jgi:hypothetical protein
MKTCLLLATASIAWAAHAADISGSLSLSPEWRVDNTASAYFVPSPVVPARHRALRQDLSLRIQEGGFNAQGIFRLNAAEAQAPEQHGIVNQFYYDAETGPGNGLTLGKKIMTWGVGFGFRPLDVVQREDRRGINPPPLTGIPMLAWDSFSADEAFTLVWQRPGSGRGNGAGEDTALAAHWYRLAAGTDLHAVARLSGRNGLEAGAGFSRAFGEEWSLHGAALNQQRYARSLNRLAETGAGILATSSPMADAGGSNALKAVAGAQWTGDSGFGILLEAWYDGEACSRAEWQRLNTLTARQRALTGLAPQSAIEGNVAWSSQAFNRPNLMRENLMTRFSYDVDQRWKSALEWLATPHDGGRAVTLSLSHEGNRQRIGGGIRWLGGAADSALAQAPLRRAAWLEWRLALP